MHLQIITLKGTQFEGEVQSLNVKTTSGEITVLDHHRPLVTQLVAGEVVAMNKEGERMSFKVNSGFLEVGEGNKATVLAN